jgi:hypothetical protein
MSAICLTGCGKKPVSEVSANVAKSYMEKFLVSKGYDVETDFLNTVRQVKCNVKLENYIEFDWCDEGRTCHISVKRAFDNKITYFKDELVVRNGASNISLKSEEMENFIINFYK